MLSHGEHCRACKENVRRLLAARYGDCRVGHVFPWPARAEAYAQTVVGKPLGTIFAALGRARGFGDFVRAERMPPCDYFVPWPPFILEFDESQHFSPARRLSLSLYPPEIRVGFPVSRWVELCDAINAADNAPPDRDERRAWYDTLRDFLPSLHGLRPTARLYASEYRWCALDDRSKKDRETFRTLLRGRLPRPQEPA